jgi:hypothetical protein
MADNVQVEAARIPDRDKLLEMLVEHVVMSLGAPFVPMKHEGVIYIRPPIG